MRWLISSHAVDRWLDRIDTEATYFSARLDILARMERAHQTGKTRQGQLAYALDHPSRPVAIVKTANQRTDVGDSAVVVTIITWEQWTGYSHDEMAEVMAAYDEMRQRVPSEWEPRRPTVVAAKHERTLAVAEEPARRGGLPGATSHEQDALWGRLMAVLETERRRVEHHIAEQSGAEDAIVTLSRVTAALTRGDVGEAKRLREVVGRYKADRVPHRQFCDLICRYSRPQAVDHGDGSCSPAVDSCDLRTRTSCGLGHGTYYCYQEGCRCPMCTNANRVACIRQKMPRYVARGAGQPVPAPHGSVSAYTNHGCRCQACRDGHRHRIAMARRRPCRCGACVPPTTPPSRPEP